MARLAAALLLFCLTSGSRSPAENKKTCPDGDHYETDVKQIAIQYEGSSFAGTLSSLNVLGARLTVTPQKLQEAALATQQWNEFVKGLVTGYNNCAITKEQYNQGLQRIYPRLKEDANELEQIRKLISVGRKADEAKLRSVLDSYLANLRQFASVSGSEKIIERIEALVTGQEKILDRQEKTLSNTEQILAKLDALERTNKEAPLATPSAVQDEIRKSLLVKADEAEAAYKKGYELLDRYRFAEAIPHLQHALGIIKLPDFYAALGRAYLYEPDLNKAQQVLEDGLAQLADGKDQRHEAILAVTLGSVLRAKGALDDALRHTQQALEIEEKIYGLGHPNVARDANNIGGILKDKGDLKGALRYTQQAFEIYRKRYGPDDPNIATSANNIGLILQAGGDLEGALRYTQQALEIDRKFYGPDHPKVATISDNIGTILLDKGDLEGALRYTQQALEIDRKFYGPDHPKVAICDNNIGLILQKKGDLEGALRYMQQARDINEKIYGLDHPNVVANLNNIGMILQDKGDLDSALGYAQQAFETAKRVFGPDNPNVAWCASTIGQILQAQGDLEGALRYAMQALNIDMKMYGADDPNVARDANNVGQILKEKGDLEGALRYIQQAVDIDMKVYGPENPVTKIVAANLEAIKQTMKSTPHILLVPHL